MPNSTGQSREKSCRIRALPCLSLFVVLAICVGIFGDLIHHHEGIYSKRSCPICLNSTHLIGGIVEDHQELPEPAVSFAFHEIIIDLHSIDVITSNAIRAPPTV